MPIPNEYREIIAMLVAKTNDGDLGWKNEHSHVVVNVDDTKFTFWAGNDERSDEPFVAFGLVDVQGKMIDSWFVDESDEDYLEVYRLYKGATRHAYGVPSILKSLAGRLSEMKKAGPAS